MAIEHSLIADPHIHVPKGFATAQTEQVLSRNSLGEVVWKYPAGSVYAQMDIMNNSTAVSMAAPSDATLETDTDYVKMTGAGYPWSPTHQQLMSVVSGAIQVQVKGVYVLSFWSTLRIATNNRLMAIKFAINDTAPYSSQKILTRSTEANDDRNVSASSITISLDVDDTISFYTAASAATDATFRHVGVSAILLRDLTDA